MIRMYAAYALNEESCYDYILSSSGVNDSLRPSSWLTAWHAFEFRCQSCCSEGNQHRAARSFSAPSPTTFAMFLPASTSNMAQYDIYCPVCGAALSIPLFRASDSRDGSSAGSDRPTDEDMQWLKNVRILYRGPSGQANRRYVTGTYMVRP